MDVNDLALSIDQTMLKPTVGPVEGSEWIASNRYYGFATLCVSPFLVPARCESIWPAVRRASARWRAFLWVTA